MDRVEFEQMRCRRSITGRIIDVHQLDSRSSPESPEYESADPTKPINPNLHNNFLIQEEGGINPPFFLEFKVF